MILTTCGGYQSSAATIDSKQDTQRMAPAEPTHDQHEYYILIYMLFYNGERHSIH